MSGMIDGNLHGAWTMYLGTWGLTLSFSLSSSSGMASGAFFLRRLSKASLTWYSSRVILADRLGKQKYLTRLRHNLLRKYLFSNRRTSGLKVGYKKLKGWMLEGTEFFERRCLDLVYLVKNGIFYFGIWDKIILWTTNSHTKLSYYN
jgi:hypothetical protein